MGRAAEIVAGLIGAAGGGAFIALLRQREINKLKTEIKVLQSEVEHSDKIVENVLRDIELLKVRAQLAENKEVLFSIDNEDYGKALYAFGFYEYLELKYEILLKDKKISEEQSTFIDSFSHHLSGKELDELSEKKINDFIKNYLDQKYKSKVKNGEAPDFDNIITIINQELDKYNNMNEDNTISVASEKLSCLTLNAKQMKILYSLEYNKASYDRDNTSDEIDKDKKTEWIKKWSREILKGIGKSGAKGYFLDEEESFKALESERIKSSEENWYYIIMMELHLFEPFFPFDEKDKNEWKGIKYKSKYIDVICKKQDIVGKEFFKEIDSTFSAAVSYLDNRKIKGIIRMATIMGATIAVASVASVFAPAIIGAITGSAGSASAAIGSTAFVGAKMAVIGGGITIAHGAGISGGVILITGGGALLGAASSFGLTTSLSSSILALSPKMVLYEAAKLLTSINCIILKNKNAQKNVFDLYDEITKIIDLEKKQKGAVENNKDYKEDKEKKEVVKNLKKSIDYLEKTRERIDAEKELFIRSDDVEPSVNFICNKVGCDSMAINNEIGLNVGQKLQINGTTELTNIIRFNDGGYVESIKLIKNPSTFSLFKFEYEVEVVAAGPRGVWSGAGHLKFTDKTGDTYSLSVLKNKRDFHVFDFKSDNPVITKIEWSN